MTRHWGMPYSAFTPDARAEPLPEPPCRFARDAAARPDVVAHVCTTRDGEPIPAGSDKECWAESRAQVRDSGAVLREAERAVRS